MAEEKDSWAQLVSTSDAETQPILLEKHKFLIGRSKVTDLCFSGNKMVSGTHCFIERDQHGKAWLQDTSTNGTLLNMTKKLCGSRASLQHGDEIHIVYKKGNEELNISYLFQDAERLREEEMDATLENSSDLDTTAENSDTVGTSETARVIHEKRKLNHSSEEERVADEDKHLAKKRKSHDQAIPPQPAEPDVSSAVTVSETKEESKAQGSDVKGGSVSEVNVSNETKKKSTDTTEECKDAFEETLLCIICQEILHDCISCQPCMHSFCNGCYSEWMQRSEECPSCRGQVERVSKNHIVNNLVDAYLASHPDKKRPEAELKELEAKAKVTNQPMKPPTPEMDLSELIDEGDDDYGNVNNDDDGDRSSDSDLDSSESDDGGVTIPVAGTGFTMLTPRFGTPLFGGTYVPPMTICRQCPQAAAVGPIGTAVNAIGNMVSRAVGLVKGPDSTLPAATAAGATHGAGTSAGPSTAAGETGTTGSTVVTSTGDVKVMPVAPDYTCPARGNHILCQCCLQSMPDRRGDSRVDVTVPKQQCVLCYRMYCHLYWGCQKADCSGCLASLKDMNFGKKCLPGLILENPYESDIFQNYLESKILTVKDVLMECCQKMDAGEYHCTDAAVNSNTVLCYACGLRQFRELAYQYRRDIPKKDLPVAITARPDCYWGKNCRTQKGKIQHATNFNHICEQTRTA